MSNSHYLSPLFNPKNIAIIGASQRDSSLGKIVVDNLLAAGFSGRWYPVNPKYTVLVGQRCYPKVSDIDDAIDMAIVAVSADNIARVLSDCGAAGVKAAILVSNGARGEVDSNSSLMAKINKVAKKHRIRILGPDSLGMVRPHDKLNASSMVPVLKSGKLALVSQSGALCAAMLDWAHAQDIGFSAVVSVGVGVDIDFGEVLDFLVSDPKTHSILLYIEGVHHARSFMSGLRAAARVKPVIVVKAGRYKSDIKRLLVSHTGALVGSEQVFDAALSRAGVVRGRNLGDLFSVASILARGLRIKKPALAILSNGMGPSIMACDRIHDLNLPLATLAESTLAALEHKAVSAQNPVNLGAAATADHYEASLELLLNDASVGGVLVLLTPQPCTDPLAVAKRVASMAKRSRIPVITCWMGDATVQEGRRWLYEAGVPSFRLPENAVQAFASIIEYHHNQALLIQTPGSVSNFKPPLLENANQLIAGVLSEPRNLLTEVESKQLLSCFHIPVVATGIARTSEKALQLAQQMGFPVVLKVYSKAITHKSDVGGVKLNINNVGELFVAYENILQQAEAFAPGLVEGVVVEPMVACSSGRELLVGMVRDPVFGPVISFGSGGITAELLADSSVALPPLNRVLAQELVSRTRVSKLLDKIRGIPAANKDAVIDVLLRVSEIACEIPAISELDINPLIVDENQAVVVDSRIVVDDYRPETPYGHTAIHPYPSDLIFTETLRDGTQCVIRPIKPDDAEMERAFVDNLSDQAKFYRFLHTFKTMTPEMLAQFTLIDYDREMAFVAVVKNGECEQEIAVCRYVTNRDLNSCEFAIVVGDDWQRKGLARKLMIILMDYARFRGLVTMEGDILADNYGMLQMMNQLGFAHTRSQDDASLVRVSICL